MDDKKVCRYLYSIMDRKARLFGVPFTALNDGLAIRVFGKLSQEEGSDISMFPEDFCLYRIGEFNLINGEVISETPEKIMDAMALRKEN